MHGNEILTKWLGQCCEHMVGGLQEYSLCLASKARCCLTFQV